jgi:hypothetical protein
MRLVRRPADLDLKWTDEDRRIFPGANEAWEAWRGWCAANEVTDDQVYRKLLLDLFFDYRNAHHLGAEFDTMDITYSEFNECTGTPVRSIEDYVDRIRALLDFEVDHRLTSPHELAMAKFSFIVSGSPARFAPP